MSKMWILILIFFLSGCGESNILSNKPPNIIVTYGGDREVIKFKDNYWRNYHCFRLSGGNMSHVRVLLGHDILSDGIEFSQPRYSEHGRSTVGAYFTKEEVRNWKRVKKWLEPLMQECDWCKVGWAKNYGIKKYNDTQGEQQWICYDCITFHDNSCARNCYKEAK